MGRPKPGRFGGGNFGNRNFGSGKLGSSNFGSGNFGNGVGGRRAKRGAEEIRARKGQGAMMRGGTRAKREETAPK